MSIANESELIPRTFSFEQGNKTMRALLGGKGANLAEMSNIGLPVTPGFTITTEVCNEYLASEDGLEEDLKIEVLGRMQELYKKTGKEFGNKNNPLLVSVRSGAAVSMPGMMETILNLGLNDKTVKGMVGLSGDERFVYDCYRRFIQMFSNVVLEIEPAEFNDALDRVKYRKGIYVDYEIPAKDLLELINEYKNIVKTKCGREFPQDVNEQLFMAIESVFRSWNCDNAVKYRANENIPDDLGTAVNVQVMAFGNMGNDCGTGVAFTRNPSTGIKELYGDFLLNAQGEDVVAGIRQPSHISKLQEEMPAVFNQLLNIFILLERHYRDMQDIEFTIERGRLYMLQTRNAKRTAQAAVKCAVDMAKEGLITVEEALMRVTPDQVNQMLHPQIDPEAKYEVLAKGLPASPGAACGIAVFSSEKAVQMEAVGERVVLVRTETSTDDISGMIAAKGILTSRGGLTSHAAVVARGMGKPCVCGCEAIKVDEVNRQFTARGIVIKEGDLITIGIDGTKAEVIIGSVPMIDANITDDLMKLLDWADKKSDLKVRTNADTPEDAAKALEFGAQGIGLCRTEHMFMAPERRPVVQAMIMAESTEERVYFLNQLLPMQRDDFYGILSAMTPFPATIRLLDPPLHEFLPEIDEIRKEMIELKASNAPMGEFTRRDNLLKKIQKMSEKNPMLGHRGCRLGITYPEIYRMQAQAIFEAMYRLESEGTKTNVEVEIPLVMDVKELSELKTHIEEVYSEIKADNGGVELEWSIGTMIELPRACVVADELAVEAEFFSFGTNDLTQTALGFSRDDAEGKFIPDYVGKDIIKVNPFEVLDRKGVGSLMKQAIRKGRSVNPGMLIGICGEHGGEPNSIEFCHLIGLDYVSCSPYRVPVARLAAAQAKIFNQNQ